MNLIKWIDLPCILDERGALVPIEGGITIPFDIRRVYFLHGVMRGGARGFHAHFTLHQLMVCIGGSCRVLLDNGRDRSEVILDRADRGLLIPNMVWHEMYDFSDNTVLLLLASEHYSESDYIRDYDQFRDISRAK